MCPATQVSTASTKNCTSEQPWATQLATHVTLKEGGTALMSTHWSAQPTTSRHVFGTHSPQSAGQIEQVSKSSHFPLGQTEQTPQSSLQDAHVSTLLHVPSPQPTHLPQSVGHVEQFSTAGLQMPLPHASQGPQSGAQERQSSAPLQKPSPQSLHTPQSPGQLEHDSPASQAPLPHVVQRPQSLGQLEHVSLPASQVPSPQSEHLPQSWMQEPHVSPLLQVPSPQLAQAPQSCGQLPHVSPPLQVPSPQLAQAPQSGAQLEHVSPAPHFPSPQAVLPPDPPPPPLPPVPTSLSPMVRPQPAPAKRRPSRSVRAKIARRGKLERRFIESTKGKEGRRASIPERPPLAHVRARLARRLALLMVLFIEKIRSAGASKKSAASPEGLAAKGDKEAVSGRIEEAECVSRTATPPVTAA
jgi:hypothetical protein